MTMPVLPSEQRELRTQIKELLVTTLRLEGVHPEQIGDGDSLFSPDNRLGLDSLAALELLSAIEYTFKIRFPNDGSAKHHFESVATLAAFVQSARS
ncbi:MAG TPA: phosphopantetheine-binding protein [Myxococcaceae bacterium]|nr:phosphopantetheine-binding protein [Myxococcaceae bacterium]